MRRRRLTLLGATGSVGRSTLDVVARHSDRIEVHALTAHRDDSGLFELCERHRPAHAVLVEADAAARLRERLATAGITIQVQHGRQALVDVVSDPAVDLVMSAIVGAAGLLPTLAAVAAAKQVLIANKEPLVMAGALLMRSAAESGAQIIPIDSEHNAIFQCLPGDYRCGVSPAGVRKLVLTASGGPFREWPAERLAEATPEQALRHPNWVMGPKISVDSATLMNKGLELIEAATLYRLPEERVEIVIHPESTIHSLVEYVDGSMLAQIGQPDMRVPIAHALAWPERWESGVSGVDLAALSRMHFEAPDPARFPCLRLAREALRAGGPATNCLNAANEIAVEAFLGRRLGFAGIPALIESCLDAAERECPFAGDDLESVLAIDEWARCWSLDHLAHRHGSHGSPLHA